MSHKRVHFIIIQSKYFLVQTLKFEKGLGIYQSTYIIEGYMGFIFSIEIIS